MNTTGDTWKLGHRPALDGLRGLAIIGVLLCHFDNPVTSPFTAAGEIGVMVFFTLSGFLITALLLDERTRTGRVNLRRFYQRRALRLFPALFTAVALVWALGGVSGGMAASVFGYVSNWYAVGHPDLNALSQTWTLAIEEQFYLVWPVLLILVARRGARAVQWTAAVGAVASFAEYLTLAASGSHPGWAAHGTDTHAGALLLGCALAAWMHRRPEGQARPRLATVLLCGLMPLVVTFGWVTTFALPLLVPVMTAGMLFCVAQGDGPRWLARPELRFLGVRSYSIYVWHFPVLVLGWGPLAHWAWQPRAAVLCALGCGVALLSYRYVEHPFLRLKARQAVPASGTPQPTNRLAEDAAAVAA